MKTTIPNEGNVLATVKKFKETVARNAADRIMATAPNTPERVEAIKQSLEDGKPIQSDQLNSIFQKIRKKRYELNIAKKYIKESVEQEDDYEEIKEQFNDAKAALQGVMERVRNREEETMQKIDDLKSEIAEDEELLQDNLLSKMTTAMQKGQAFQLSLFDEFHEEYIAIPQFAIVPKKEEDDDDINKLK